MRLTVAVTIASVAAGCTSLQGYYPGSQVVDVDGIEIMVRELPGRNRGYQAAENRPTMATTLSGIDPSIYSRNVRAIERVTGCVVDRDSIQNTSNNTIASVICPS